MPNKRPYEQGATNYPSYSSKKRRQHRHDHPNGSQLKLESDNSHLTNKNSDSITTANGFTEASKRIALLGQLSSEILEDDKLAEQCSAIAGDDFIAAALNLRQVFRSKQSMLSSVPKPLSNSSNEYGDLPIIPHSFSTEKVFQLGRPELPPITDPSLAETPFNHRGNSVSGKPHSANANYDRLEFIGDAYIELIATRLICPRFPTVSAGRLSQIRESLVKNETLAEFSLAYKFDERANVSKTHGSHGQDVRKSWTKVLGDIFEAYVAAVVQSDPQNGFATAERWLTALWTPKLSGVNMEGPENPKAKEDLSRKIMGKDIRVEYREEAQSLAFQNEGKVWYTVGVYLTGWGWENQLLGSGRGLSKKEAGARAAMDALSNPLTAQVGAVKRAFDEEVRQARDSNAVTVSLGHD